MNGWQVRLQTEYKELKERFETLHEFNVNIRNGRNATSVDEWDYRLLCEQEEVMARYLHILEIRAAINGIAIGCYKEVQNHE